MDEGGSAGFTDLLKVEVLDSGGREVGHVQEMALAGGLSPEIGYLGVHLLWTDRVGEVELVRRAEDLVVLVPFSEVENFSEEAFELKSAHPEFPLVTSAGKTLLRRDILNKQMIDACGAKIHRVDEILLVRERGRLRIAGLEVSKGLLIGSSTVKRYISRLRKKHADCPLPETIPWEEVQGVEEDAIVITGTMRS